MMDAAVSEHLPAYLKPAKVSVMLIQLLLLAGGAFALLCVLLYFRQDGIIFFPGPNDPLLVQQQQARRVRIESPGATLEGWWIDNPSADNERVILYFGGNGEDVLYTAATAPLFAAKSLLFVNYRGYGRTPGKPGQAAFYEDGLAIYEYAIKRGVRPEHIVVMGRSLGSGVASMLAGRLPIGGAILITPFDSLASVAAARYSIVPVRWLLRHPFPSTDWAKQSKTPVLMLSAEHDATIPPAHAQRLFDAWAGPKQIHQLAGMGHNDVEQHPDYYPFINEFLKKLNSASNR